MRQICRFGVFVGIQLWCLFSTGKHVSEGELHSVLNLLMLLGCLVITSDKNEFAICSLLMWFSDFWVMQFEPVVWKTVFLVWPLNQLLTLKVHLVAGGSFWWYHIAFNSRLSLLCCYRILVHIYTQAAPLKAERSFLCVFNICPRYALSRPKLKKFSRRLTFKIMPWTLKFASVDCRHIWPAYGALQTV